MRITSIFSWIMTMISNFPISNANITIISAFSYDPLSSFVNNFNFLFFELIPLLCALLRICKTFSCNLCLCIDILIFYGFKWQYCRHWKTWWNIFTYFFLNEFSGLFLHPSIFSIKPFRICIKSKWCFFKFLISIKF